MNLLLDRIQLASRPNINQLYHIVANSCWNRFGQKNAKCGPSKSLGSLTIPKHNKYTIRLDFVPCRQATWAMLLCCWNTSKDITCKQHKSVARRQPAENWRQETWPSAYVPSMFHLWCLFQKLLIYNVAMLFAWRSKECTIPLRMHPFKHIAARTALRRSQLATRSINTHSTTLRRHLHVQTELQWPVFKLGASTHSTFQCHATKIAEISTFHVFIFFLFQRNPPIFKFDW